MTVREKAALGLAILTVLKVSGTVIARLAAIILALLLSPEDFGLFAVASFFVGIFTLVADVGLGTELVRRSDASPATLESAFTIRIGMAGVIMASTPLTGAFVAWAYRDPRFALLIPITTIPVLAFAVAFPSRILALQRLQFARAALPDQLAKLVAPVAAIGFALLGLSYWSFPLSTIVASVLAIAFFQIAVPWRPRLRFDASASQNLLALGGFIMFTSLARFVASSLDLAFVGFFAGAGAAGFYVVASTWGIFLSSSLSGLISDVTYPLFAKIHDSKERLGRALRHAVRYYGGAAVYLSVGVLLFARRFVVTILGETWAISIIPMQILSVSGLLAGISATLFDALIALGEPRGVFKISVVSVALLAAGLPPAILRAGLVGAAVVVDSISVVSMVFALWLVGNRLGLRSTSLVRPLAKPLASAALTVPILFPLEQALGLGLAEFFVLVGGYSFLYGALLSIVTRGSAIKEALSLVRLVLARRGPE